MLIDKDKIIDEISGFADRVAPLVTEIGEKVWTYAERGLAEYRSVSLITEVLRENGFSVRTGICGFPTGFIAELGSGKPVISLLCEYDALPGLSSERPGEPGHGCGHNIFAAGAVGSALVLKEILLSHSHSGTIRVYGTPAEESYASKMFYVKNGLFDDVDCSVGFHASDRNGVCYSHYVGTKVKEYTFHGKSAHAGSEPWNGCSALDAVELMNVAVNFYREHVPPDVRMHYIISRGGDTINIVPDLAQSIYTVRALETDLVERVYKRVDTISEAAAMATGCTVSTRFIDSTASTILNRPFCELAQSYVDRIGPPPFTKEDQRVACDLGFEQGLDRTISPLPATPLYNGGGSDEGDVSWVTPHMSVMMANLAQGTPLHNILWTKQVNFSAAYTALMHQIKATCCTLYEVLLDSSLIPVFKKANAEALAGRSYPRGEHNQPDFSFFPNLPGVSRQHGLLLLDLAALPFVKKGTFIFVYQGEKLLAKSEIRDGVTSVNLPASPGGLLTLKYAQSGMGDSVLLGYFH